MPASPTMQQLVENPEWLATLPMLSEEQKKIVRHRVDKNGEIILPPWRMVTTNLRRRKTVVIAGVRGTLGASLKVALEERGHEVRKALNLSNLFNPFNSRTVLTFASFSRSLESLVEVENHGLTTRSRHCNGGRYLDIKESPIVMRLSNSLALLISAFTPFPTKILNKSSTTQEELSQSLWHNKWSELFGNQKFSSKRLTPSSTLLGTELFHF